LLATAERSPSALALVDGGVRLDYAALADRAGRLAAGLAGLGLRHGDHVVAALQNRWQMAVLHWACQIAGLIATPVNWRFTADELDYCLKDAEARAVVFEEASAAAVAGAAVSRGIARIALTGQGDATASFDELAAAGRPMLPQAGADDISLMLYTSGTTGRPKASAPSASCRSITPWACARCWPWRSSTAPSSASRVSTPAKRSP
jgi:2-furoate---CoA ligase